jgi:hypothetical protein
MPKRKKKKISVKGLVVAGLVSIIFGLYLIIWPTPYVSTGGLGRAASRYVISVFIGNDSGFIGVLIVFMGFFVLMVAYRVKNHNMSDRFNDKRPESRETELSESVDTELTDTAGTPWENNPDHTTK